MSRGACVIFALLHEQCCFPSGPAEAAICERPSLSIPRSPVRSANLFTQCFEVSSVIVVQLQKVAGDVAAFSSLIVAECGCP